MQRHCKQVAMESFPHKGNDGGQKADDDDSTKEDVEQTQTKAKTQSTLKTSIVFCT